MLTNVTAALIAGGKSKRFGSPKHMAGYGDRRLIDYAVETALSISADTIIISNFKDEIPSFNVPIYDDLVKDCGPLGGIYTALHYARGKYVAVLPVDMPLLNLKIYRMLYPSCKTEKPVTACSHKGIEPLVSIWPASIAKELKKQIDRRDFRIHYLLRKLKATEINFASLPGYKHYWFENINYKKDLEILENRSDVYKRIDQIS